MTILTKTVAISQAALVEAIELRTSNGYFALSLARAFGGGSKSDAWQLAEDHTLAELLEEAERLEISLKDAKCAIEKIPVTHTPAYLLAKGLISQADYSEHRNLLKSGKDTSEIDARFAVLGELAD